MDNKRSYKGKIFAALALAAVLAFAYFADGKREPYQEPGKAGEAVKLPEETELLPYAEEKDGAEEGKPQKAPAAERETEQKAEQKEQTPKTEESFPEKTAETEEEVPEAEKNELFCTLSVRCDTVFNSPSRVSDKTMEIIPKNGVIFAEKRVEFQDGESVFDVLLREMKNSGIHLEYVDTPIYGSVYIEGIGNLYEFDAGELSGWMYKVNGVFPNYGCSKYFLKKGDRVEFVYTCDLGKDVGSEYKGIQGGRDE